MIRHGILESSRSKVVGAPYPTDGLIERWNFNDTLTGLNGNTWSMNNASWEYYGTTLTGGKGIRMTTNNKNTIGTIADTFFTAVGTDFSLSGWFYLNSTSPWVAWGKGTWATASGAGTFVTATAGYGNGIWGNFGGVFAKVDNTTSNTWFHVVDTYKSSTRNLKHYVNNETPVSVTGTNAITGGVNWVLFDAGNGGFFSTIGCGIALLYIYNKELTAEEVSQLYNGGAGV